MAQNATGDPKRHADHTDSLHKKVVDEVESFPVQLPFEGANYHRRDDRSYPAEFYKKDPREEKLQLLRQVAHDWNKDGFHVALPDEVLDYFVQKKKYIEFENWEKWVQNNFDLANPTEVERLKRIMPQYFERRLEYLKKMLGLAYTVHKLKLLGPEDEKDMMLLYEIHKGSVPIPEINITPQGEETQFFKGFFNIRKWLGAEGNMPRPANLGSAPWNRTIDNAARGVNALRGATYLNSDTNSPWKQLLMQHETTAPVL